MRRTALFIAFILVAAPAACLASQSAGLMRRAENLMDSAHAAAARGDVASAEGRYRLADGILAGIQERDPGHSPLEVRALRERCADEMAALAGEEVPEVAVHREEAPLPQDSVRVWSEMRREGGRDRSGQGLAQRVRKTGEGEYEVEKYAVHIYRSGGETAASCTCPDFMYRALEGGFACKHIWAVVFSERLLGPGQ
ncbi:MAG: SWIM zinc finger domain-containing protein [bacterium]|nr:SWIM zinc finger domain-containing protein [bacterium]